MHSTEDGSEGRRANGEGSGRLLPVMKLDAGRKFDKEGQRRARRVREGTPGVEGIGG